MYYIVGDFIRLGSTVKDSLHSQIVTPLMLESRYIHSINRCGKKLMLHTWKVQENGLVNPILSIEFEDLKRNFTNEEKAKKESKESQREKVNHGI